MARNRELTCYVSADFAERVERRARENDLSVSSWIANTLEARLREEQLDETAREVAAEQRIEELVADARNEVEAAAEQMQQAAALASIYSIGTWELVGSEYGDVARRESLATGADRTNERAPGLPTDLVAAAADSSEPSWKEGSRGDTGDGGRARGRTATSSSSSTSRSPSDSWSSRDESDDESDDGDGDGPPEFEL